MWCSWYNNAELDWTFHKIQLFWGYQLTQCNGYYIYASIEYIHKHSTTHFTLDVYSILQCISNDNIDNGDNVRGHRASLSRIEKRTWLSSLVAM